MLIRDKMFWLGWLSCILWNIVSGFFSHIINWQNTMIFGTITILSVSYCLMEIKKEKEE